MAWYDSNWNYRIKVTVQSGKVGGSSGTHNDYRVYVDLSDLPSDFHSNVNSDGGDIRVTTSDGETEIPREVVTYDDGNDEGELHFKGTVNKGSNTDFYIYYGNASASDYAVNATYGAENVWTNYEGVWHLQEDPADGNPGDIKDSTSNDNDGEAHNSMTSDDSISGKLSGKAIDFDGSDDSLQILKDSTLDIPAGGEMTWSMWIKPSSLSKGTLIRADDLGDEGADGNRAIYFIRLLADGTIEFRVYEDGLTDSVSLNPSDTLSTGTWYHIVGTIDCGNVQKLYINASEKGSNNASAIDKECDPNTRRGIGAWYDNDDGIFKEFFNGVVDCIRIASTAFSSEWITTSYNNQNSSSTFYNVGSQETEITVVTKTIQVKANIKKEQTQTISTKGRFDISGGLPIEAKATIRNKKTGIVQAKTRIQKRFTQVLNTKGRIQIETTQDINTKSDIKVTQSLGFYDNFENYPTGDGVPSPWIQVLGSGTRWSIADWNTEFNPSRETRGLWGHYESEGNTDYYALRKENIEPPYEIKTLVTVSYAYYAGLILAWRDTGHHVRVRLSPLNDDFQIADVGGSGGSTYPSVSITSSNWYEIKAVVSKTTIKVYYRHLNDDSFTYLDEITPTTTRGLVGVSIGGYSPPDCVFDNFWISKGMATTKSSIKKELEQTINVKTSIKKQNVQTISSIGKIQRLQTLSTKGSIRKNLSKTIQSFGNIQKIQRISSVGRIEIQISQIVNTKSNIQKEFSKILESSGNIQKQKEKNIESKGRILKTYSQTTESQADLKKQQTQKIGKAGITPTSVSNYAGTAEDFGSPGMLGWEIDDPPISNAEGSPDGNYAWSNNFSSIMSPTHYLIGKNYDFSIPTNANITGIKVEFTRKENEANTGQQIQDYGVKLHLDGSLVGNNKGLSDYWSESSVETKVYGGENDTWNAGLSASDINSSSFGVGISPKNDTGTAEGALIDAIKITVYYGEATGPKASIKKNLTKIVSSKSSIKKLQESDLEGKARIIVGREQTIESRGNLKKEILKDGLLSKARIENTYQQTILAKTNIKNTKNRTINVKGRLELTSEKIINTKANIRSTQLKKVKALTAILKNFTQTINTKGRITITTIRTINTKAIIKKEQSQNIFTTGRLQKEFNQIIIVISALGRIQKESTQSITTLGRIETSSLQSIETKSAIEQELEQYITTLARITNTYDKRIKVKGNIKKIQEQEINVKGRIESSFEKIINSRARITIESNQNIDVEAKITALIEQEISTKANIKLKISKTISTKGNIKVTGIKTIIVKASIVQSIQTTINVKASIATYNIVEIIDKIRSQRLAKEVTYRKDLVKEMTYNKVTIANICEPSKKVRIKWLTAKAKIEI